MAAPHGPTLLEELRATSAQQYDAGFQRRGYLLVRAADALERAAQRLEVYSEWCSRECVASRGTTLLRQIRDGARVDAADARCGNPDTYPDPEARLMAGGDYP